MQKLNSTINIVGRGFGGGCCGSTSIVTATISATSENLIAAMRLAVEILREPSFPESDFDQIRKQQIAQVDRGRTDPGTLVLLALQSALSPFPRTDVRHVRTIEEEIEDFNKLTLD